MSAPNGFKLSGLIVEPNLASKMRLKQALLALPRFSTASPMNSLRDALDALRAETGHCDLIFIAQAIPADEIASFIKTAKEIPSAQDAAFVTLSKSTQGTDMAAAMLIGFDGMLSEPYSVDSLNDICELALRVKGERGEAREKAALSLMIADVVKQLDAVAVLKACGYESLRGMEKLRDACATFKNLSPAASKVYEDLAEKIFGDAAPAKPPEKRYVGVSKRIKNNQVAKIIGA